MNYLGKVNCFGMFILTVLMYFVIRQPITACPVVLPKKEKTTSFSAHQTLNTFLNMAEPRPFVHGKMLPILR